MLTREGDSFKVESLVTSAQAAGRFAMASRRRVESTNGNHFWRPDVDEETNATEGLGSEG
jgi:hypothetical protein